MPSPGTVQQSPTRAYTHNSHHFVPVSSVSARSAPTRWRPRSDFIPHNGPGSWRHKHWLIFKLSCQSNVGKTMPVPGANITSVFYFSLWIGVEAHITMHICYLPSVCHVVRIVEARIPWHFLHAVALYMHTMFKKTRMSQRSAIQ